MTRLTAPQIAAYAKQAGFSGVNVALAVAVSLAESGGKTDAIGGPNSDGTYDYGLWQINSVHSDLLSSGRWDLPTDNARMAYSVWRASGWHAWTTYNTGAYVSHLGSANAAAANPASGVSFGKTPKTIRFSTPTHWYGYQSQPIPPPPPKFVKYTRVTKPTDLAGSGIIVPKGGYIVEISAYAAAATGHSTKDDPRQVTMEKWLRLYWGHNLKKALRLHNSVDDTDFVWLFSHTVAFQPKVSTESGGPPDPGIADPNLHIGNPLQWLIDFIHFITDPHNWLRLALFVVGGLLVLFAAYKLADRTPPPAAATVGAVVEGVAA